MLRVSRFLPRLDHGVSILVRPLEYCLRTCETNVRFASNDSQVLAALSVSLGSMVVGYSSSYTSPGLVSMRDNSTATFEVTKEIVSTKPLLLTNIYRAYGGEILFKRTASARGLRNVECTDGTGPNVILLILLILLSGERIGNETRLFSNIFRPRERSALSR